MQVLGTVQHGGAPVVVAVRQGSILATAFHVCMPVHVLIAECMHRHSRAPQPELGADTRFHQLFVDIVRAAKH